MRTTGVFLALLLVLAASGCAQPVDLAAEEAALRQTAVEWENAANAKNLDQLVGLYADDASVFPPNAPSATGKEGIRTVWSQLIESPGFTTDLETTKVGISSAGDLAYLVGTYEDSRNDPEGNPVSDRGKWVVVSKKQPDGSWEIVADIWNSDQPATPSASE
jgi:uncharacterized protein (TIGR02246 family)